MRIAPEVLRSVRVTAGLPEPMQARIAAALEPVHLAGGEWLFEQGDPGDTLYLVASGRLEVIRSAGGEEQVVALLQSGDTVGELALLEGGTRAAGVRALRDSDLLALHRADVIPLLADQAFASALLAQVTRLLRADPPTVDPASRRAVVAVVGADARTVAGVVEELAASLHGQGVATAVLRADDVGCGPDELRLRTGQRLDELERTADVVLLDGGAIEDGWSLVCARQADRVVLLAEPRDTPPRARVDLHGCDLVAVGDHAWPTPLLDRWDATVRPRSHHRIRRFHRRSDTARLARRVSGRALGLVLSGGGARGLAHVGVLQAIEEAGIVVDRFGGTSMGALISALAATGRPSEEVLRVVQRELVDRRPFADYTVPRHGLIRGQAAVRMLRRVFGDTDIRHLARSWFAVSADLEAAEVVVHRDGPIWEAAGASMSLPGIAPALIWRGRVVVDGGVLDNLPVGVMAADGEGQVLASDLTRQRGFGRADGAPRVPAILETLSATMSLSNLQQVEESRQKARLVIEPQVSDVGLLDFGQVDSAVAAGYAAARAALEGVDRLGHPLDPPAG